VAPSLSLQNREQDTVDLGNKDYVKLIILDSNLQFITHIKQGLTKEKVGKSVAQAKRNDVLATIWKGRGGRVQRSKLKICMEILCILASNGPMKLTQLMTKVELNKTRLRQYLRLLKNRNLVERQNLGKNEIFYVATERGLKVLKVIDPIIKEAHRIQALQF
jgi:predicted transcriptional regulator